MLLQSFFLWKMLLHSNLTFEAMGFRLWFPRMQWLSMPTVHAMMYDSSLYGQQKNIFKDNQSGSKAITPSSRWNVLRPWLIRLMQLLVPNGPWPHFWVVLLSVELHVKQPLQCSVLELSVNNEIIVVCSGHEKYTAALQVQLHLYHSAVPVTGEEASKGYGMQDWRVATL